MTTTARPHYTIDKDISLEAYCQFGHSDLSRSLFIQGAKWYREQLKK
jgi:hypothetical protein